MPTDLIEAVVDQAAKQSCRDVALISALVWVTNSQGIDVWVTYITLSKKGAGQGEFILNKVELGPRKYETPDWLVAAADVVLEVNHGGALSGDEAEAMRQEFIAAARRRFKQVHVCDTEVDAAKLQAKLWPGERSRKIEAETITDYASRGTGRHTCGSA